MINKIVPLLTDPCRLNTFAQHPMLLCLVLFPQSGDFVALAPISLGLTDPEAYENQYGVPTTTKGDIDGDNDLDFDDIPGFVNLLAGGAQTVPEPSAMAMVATALLSVLVHTRLRRPAV